MTASVSHILFSHLGYNPTDDGYFLAFSRRLLDGQIPYRDFICIRPLLTSYLYMPLVRWGGPHTFLIGRFIVWLEFAAIAWLWTSIARRFSARWSRLEQTLVGLCAFVSTVQIFNPMPWYTIDGVFWTTLGLYAITSGETGWKRLSGFACVGLAYLCKPNFFFMGPVVILLLGKEKRWKAFAAWGLPGLLFAFYLYAHGALAAGVQQMLSQPGALRTAFWPYVYEPEFFQGLCGGVAASLLFLIPWRFVRLGVGLGGMLLFVFFDNFTAFGAAMGLAGGLAFRWRTFRQPLWLGTLALTLAWMTSISLGYNTPDLAMGAVGVFFAALAWQDIESGLWRHAAVVGLAGCTIFLGWEFVQMRTTQVYMDAPREQLTYPVDSLLAGGEGLYTNGNTHAFLKDLQKLVEARNKPRYAIIPDYPGYWVKSPDRNPLPLDWIFMQEISQPFLKNRVEQELLNQQGQLTIFVEKVKVFYLRDGLLPIGYHPIAAFIKQHYRKVGETPFFEVYE